jgi:NitT/TauT family transport system permease protein
MKGRVLDIVLLCAGVLVLWQALSFAFGTTAIATPFDTVARAVQLLHTPSFWGHAASTGEAFGLASIVSIVGGVGLGLWLGIDRFAGDVADPILGTLYAIPKITLYPLILLVFGLGLSAKVAFGVLHGILPVAMFTMNAVRNVAPIYGKTARMLRLPAISAVATISAPAALPEILSGIRAGVALTLFGTIIGELFASTSGIGVAIMRATDIHNVVDILALTLLLFLFAATINGLLHYVERRVHHDG